MWWLVSPQNPLKDVAGMAPLPARIAAARLAARHPRIRVSAVEVALGTRYAVDTVAALQRRYPKTRFIWLIGADNLVQLHRWKDWRRLACRIPIAVLARPGYGHRLRTAPAMAWLRRGLHRATDVRHWREWELPAIVILDIQLSPLSATQVRARDPGWAAAVHVATETRS